MVSKYTEVDLAAAEYTVPSQSGNCAGFAFNSSGSVCSRGTYPFTKVLPQQQSACIRGKWQRAQLALLQLQLGRYRSEWYNGAQFSIALRIVLPSANLVLA